MMIYARYAVLVFTSLLVDLTGLVFVPLALCATARDARLPRWAWVWDNDREPLGDEARGEEMRAATGLRYWFLRWHWLCVRNPGNNFGYLCGVEPLGDFVVRGNPRTSDQGEAGWLWVRCENAFCWYLIWRWSRRRCLRIFIGWKIQDCARTRAQIVLVINPVMSFEEK